MPLSSVSVVLTASTNTIEFIALGPLYKALLGMTLNIPLTFNAKFCD